MVRFKKNLLKKAKFWLPHFLEYFLEPYSDPILTKIFLERIFSANIFQ